MRQRVDTGKPWWKTVKHGSGVVVATAGRLLFTSGITARAPDGTLVGAGDMAAQIRQVMQNLADVMQAAGTDMRRVVKFTFFTTDIKACHAAQEEYRRHYHDFPGSTLVEVRRLVNPEMLIEGEAVVALG